MVTTKSNDFLAQIPDDELQALTPQLELMSLRKGGLLIEAGRVPGYVYFPVGAVISVFTGLEDGFVLETAMVGKRGMVGLSNVGNPSFYSARVREVGLAYRMTLRDFLDAKSTYPGFAKAHHLALVDAFRRLHVNLLCAKHHSLEMQMVRWMLASLDNSASMNIVVTHFEMSQILGFTREFTTLTLGKLAMRGLIALERGRIEVLDRHGLELLSCECYWLAKGSSRPVFSELVSPPPPRRHSA